MHRGRESESLPCPKDSPERSGVPAPKDGLLGEPDEGKRRQGDGRPDLSGFSTLLAQPQIGDHVQVPLVVLAVP